MTIQRLLLRFLLPLLAAAPLAAVAVPGPVTNVSSSSVSLSSLPDPNGPNVRTFTATFTNVTNVTSDDGWVSLTLNVWPQQRNSCKIAAHAYLTDHPMTLWTDDGLFVAPVTAPYITEGTGSAPFHENSSCRLYRSASYLIRNNTDVTLTVKVEIREPFSGIRYGYGASGATNWVWVGHIWTVFGQTYYTPEPIEITPTSGSAPDGLLADPLADVWFRATMRDWNGALNMWHAELLFSRNDATGDPWAIPNSQICGVVFELNANRVWLKNDSGSQVNGVTYEPAGSEQPIANSRCQVTVPAASAQPPMIEVLDAYSVRVRFKLRFNSTGWGSGFDGKLKSHLWPVDQKYSNGNWINTGEWSKNNGPWMIGGSGQVNDSFTLRFGPGRQHVALGETTHYSVTPVSNGYTGPVTLSAPTAPGVTAVITPQVLNVGQTATVQLTASPSASLGPVPLILTATAVARKVTTIATVEVEGKEFPIKTVNLDSAGPGSTAWEASSAADPKGPWAMSWKDLSAGGTARLAIYDQGWKSEPLTNIKDDVNLTWDPVRERFAFVVIREDNVLYGYRRTLADTSSVWYDACPYPFQRVLNQTAWDYPSIAVTTDGKIAIGAVEGGSSGGAVGLSVVVSETADGDCPTWGPRHFIDTGGGGRVVAAGTAIHAFTMTGAGSLESIRKRTFLSNTAGWSGSEIVVSLGGGLPAEFRSSPLVFPSHPNVAHRIFFGKLFSVAGRADGRWIVGFQRRYAPDGLNNVWICRSWAGCTAVEADPNTIQFMPEVAIASDGYWVTFFKFESTGPPRLNARFHYVPDTGPAAADVLRDPSSGTTVSIDPEGWSRTPGSGYDRCGLDVPCFALGDFNTIASTSDRVLLFPYVGAPGEFQHQAFLQDPPAGPSRGTSRADACTTSSTGRPRRPSNTGEEARCAH